MSSISIAAFLAFLSAFNVSAATVKQVSDILYASQASTTNVVATTTLQATPQGGTTLTTEPVAPPVNNPAPQQTFGDTITPMPDQSDILILAPKDGRPTVNGVEHVISTDPVNPGEWNIHFALLDASGNRVKFGTIDATWTDGTTTGTVHGKANSLGQKDDEFFARDGEGYWGVITFPDTATSVTLTSGALSKTINLTQ